MKRSSVRWLNVAGSRESKEPGIYEWVMTVMEKMLEEYITTTGNQDTVSVTTPGGNWYFRLELR